MKLLVFIHRLCSQGLKHLYKWVYFNVVCLFVLFVSYFLYYCSDCTIRTFELMPKLSAIWTKSQFLSKTVFNCVEKPKLKYTQRSIQTNVYIIISQWAVKLKKTKLLEARENANDPLAIVFSFTIDWLRGSRKSSRPVKIKLSKTKVIPDYFWHSMENSSKAKVFTCYVTGVKQRESVRRNQTLEVCISHSVALSQGYRGIDSELQHALGFKAWHYQD